MSELPSCHVMLFFFFILLLFFFFSQWKPPKCPACFQTLSFFLICCHSSPSRFFLLVILKRRSGEASKMLAQRFSVLISLRISFLRLLAFFCCAWEQRRNLHERRRRRRHCGTGVFGLVHPVGAIDNVNHEWMASVGRRQIMMASPRRFCSLHRDSSKTFISVEKRKKHAKWRRIMRQNTKWRRMKKW